MGGITRLSVIATPGRTQTFIAKAEGAGIVRRRRMYGKVFINRVGSVIMLFFGG